VFEYAPSLLRRAGVDPEGFLNEIITDGFTLSRIHELNGEASPVSVEDLRSAFSVNLVARRKAA
jgi:hypothetical protein